MRIAAFTTIIALAAIALPAEDFTQYSIERMFAGYKFAEGPAWSPDHYLIFCDVPTNHIVRWTPGAQRPEMFRDNSNGATGTAFDAQGRAYVCESRSRRVIRIDPKKNNRVETLAEKFEGKRLNAPNDIAVRRDGHAWFTDPAFGYQSTSRELDFYGVFHIGPKGDLDVVARPKGRPNGIAISANGRQLYVSNSDEHNIRVYDIDKAGAVSNERIFASNIDGVPDGVRLDEKGNVYVAAREVIVYSPDAKILHKFQFSEKPSNLVFGDPDHMTLYVTARTSVYRIRLAVKGAQQYQ